MGKNLAEKIISTHLVRGEMRPGAEIGLRIDQTLTQDATGTMAYLEFEAMGIDRVRTEKSVAYIDHNTLQSGFENADDHRYIQSVAARHGIWYSRPGNGICHQVHLERFGAPGKTLIGSDSHTPTAGGLGMLAFGAGGLDVAVAMGGGAYYISMPSVIRVELKGALRPFVTAKDVSLEILRILSVRGGVGHVIEWGGPGVKSLTVPERATITNMGAELGATTSIFPSDEQTLSFLRAQGREQDYTPLQPDPDAEYERVIEIDLSALEPLIACPHMPDRVVPVSSLKGMKVDQVCIGSCTNSSLQDMLKASALLKGRHIADSVSMSVSPGSRQVLTMLADSGALTDLLSSGARLLECACGPCIGMGFSPNSGGVSLRTFNRNFEGRSGTRDAKVYLVSPETAVASALTGSITDPRSLFEENACAEAVSAMKADGFSFRVDDSGILPPAAPQQAEQIEVLRGPNIKEIPMGRPLPESLSLAVSLKVGDNITTDHIMPAGAKILPYRSNVPKLSEFCFGVCDAAFPERAKKLGESVIVGGSNYGQGSSREHAALVPLYLGVRAVIAKSFARIHAANLVNAGILPLTFADPEDYDRVSQGETVVLNDLHEGLEKGRITAFCGEGKDPVPLCCAFSERQRAMLLAGGLLNLTKEENQ
ncbi:MAG: aconitate hydratase [Oscillospiraceae bacterium]|nr:aconitate hydratase [Oscillospiraceae bacterium]